MLLAFLRRLFTTDWATASFEQLRKGCVEGEEGARATFVRRYESLVWHAVKARIPRASRQDQEEVVADTFIALLKDDATLLSRWEGEKGLSPEGWIRRQAVLQAANCYRRLTATKRVSEVPLEVEGGIKGGDSHPDRGPSPEFKLSSEQDLGLLVAELKERLSPSLWLTFELLYVRELEPAEAATALGVTLDVIYTRKRRVVVSLEELLTQRMSRVTP